jgi:hypothetical protein|tara:strand:- start:4465 stop:4896 length:432 start_codon:yes stop_codon:yes gene_type:complete
MPRKKLEDLEPVAKETPKPRKRIAPTPVETITYEEDDYEAEIVTSKESTTRRVKLDLEVDTSIKDLGPNPYAKLIHLAHAFDQWRIFPRIFISVYIVLLYQVVHWYMNLGVDATMEQSGLVSVVVGAGAAWFGLYTGSSKGRK